jgi:hypothetical protein
MVESGEDEKVFGSTGRTDVTVAHGNDRTFVFFSAAQPFKTAATTHRPRQQKCSRAKREAQRETARDWVDLCVMNDQAARGNSIRNVVPRPTSDVKSIEPL